MSGTSPSSDATIQGGAFHAGLQGGQASGTIQVAETTIHFDSAKGHVALPIAGLQIALGGANDRLLFFTHPEHPQTTIHTADHTLLNHPRLQREPALTAQVAKVRVKKRAALAVILTVVAILVFGLVGLILSKDRIVTAATAAIPTDWEVALGDKLFEQITSRTKMVTNAELDARLKKITEPLLAGIKDNRYPLKFHIADDATLNAFAMPGGHVVIHSGLLLAADTPEEVAGVLAHEIAHVTRRHSFRNVLSSAGLYLVLQTFLGDLSGLMAVIVNNSAFLIDRKFSRDFEREADETGWEYLLQAKVNPRGMIEFFKKLNEEEKKNPIASATGDSLAFLSTHPGTQERMSTLEEKWRAVSSRKDFLTFDLDYDQFKETLRTQLHTAPKPDPKKKAN